MAEIGVKQQQFYIATTASPADDRTRVLKHGKMFAVFDRYGDIESFGPQEQGIFYDGTRFLSKLELILGRSRPLLLSSTVKADNSMFSADLANLDMSYDHVSIPRGTLHVTRSKFLWHGSCYEKFRLVNYGLTAVQVPLRLRFGGDFADIFEVRGVKRKTRGQRQQDTIERDAVVLSYKGADGVPRRTRIKCTPKPDRISSTELQFDVSLEPRAESIFTLTVSCELTPETPVETYESAFMAATSELNAYKLNACLISSSSDEFNDWIKRSQADVEMMILGNPERDYPYAGVPWYSTIFGRDGIITALECLWLHPEIARGVLEFLAETQATAIVPEKDAEPGKIVHEMRKGEMSALGEVPFSRYYGTVDATPLFIMLADAYYGRTADRAFVEKIWPNVERALDWIDNYGDCDGDGFVEYARHAKTGLVHQGWKDSNDSIFHADGTLATGPIALCEVQGYVYAAKRGAARLATLLGNKTRAGLLESQAEQLRTRFHEAFWCYDLCTYALALDGDKKPCRVRASNAGHCLYTGIANPENARVLAQSLMGKDFFSGWGIRTVAKGESRYNPISYHNGSVWPHDNALIAAGLARYGYKSQAAEILSSLLGASMEIDLHRLPELFCGLERRAGEGPTLYPVACAPQAWAAASVFLILQACLGVTVDAEAKQIAFNEPYLPEAVPRIWIKQLRLNDSSVDVLLERQDYLVMLHTIEKQGELEVIVT